MPRSSPAVEPSPARRSSGAEAVAYIRGLIFAGELRPGERVPQDEVAKALGVSRIPVREALIALEREGWVTIELHRGAFINTLDEQAVRDHYELFGLVYGFAAQRALQRGTPELGERLGQIRTQCAATSEPVAFGRLARRFHQAVVSSARSPRVEVVLRAMSALIPGEFFAAVPAAIPIEQKGIAAITRSVAAGDGERTAAEYARMMRRVGDQVVKVIAQRGLFDVPNGS